MIKFFRNIRQKLLAEGKTTNYLKYAIGEIVLVVIGILIALQVNNWNESRKLQKLEVSYYENLYRDLQQDSLEYHNKQSNAQGNIEKLTNILNFIKSNYDIDKTNISEVSWGHYNVFKDTMALWISISQAGFVQFPHIFENTITDLRTTGNIKLLKNKILKDELIKYYNLQNMYDDWNASYLPNRTDIDLVINRILPLNARVAYNDLDIDKMYQDLKINHDYPDFLERIKQQKDLRALTIGMYHIQTRIIIQCAQRASNLEILKNSVLEEIKKLK